MFWKCKFRKKYFKSVPINANPVFNESMPLNADPKYCFCVKQQGSAQVVSSHGLKQGEFCPENNQPTATKSGQIPETGIIS